VELSTKASIIYIFFFFFYVAHLPLIFRSNQVRRLRDHSF